VDTTCRLRPSGYGERVEAFKRPLCPNERVSNASTWRSEFVHAKDEDMRDFRDAKAMARSLRAGLAARSHKITVGESLDLIAHAFGVADWNTLSAMIIAAAKPPERVGPPPRRSDPLIQAAMDRVGVSRDLEVSLHRTIQMAQQRRQGTASLEHLLLSLIDDPDAATLLRACDVDPDALRPAVAAYVDQALPPQDAGPSPTPSAGFERVIQRAVIHAQASNRTQVTGASVLIAIFSERESQARRFLDERGMTRYDAVNFIAHGIPKSQGGAAA
jgi:hypothetical protein